MSDNTNEKDQLKEGRVKFDKTIKKVGNIFNSLLNKAVDAVDVDELNFEFPKNHIFDKVSNIKNTVVNKVNEINTKLHTSFVQPKVTDLHYVAEICIAGVDVKKLELDFIDRDIILNIDTTGISQEIREYWSVSKKRVVLSLDGIADADTKGIKSSYANGVFTITVPRLKIEDELEDDSTSIKIN